MQAVELGKRYSYGRAHRVINGCLANFIQSEYFLDITQQGRNRVGAKFEEIYWTLGKYEARENHVIYKEQSVSLVKHVST